MLYFIGWDMMLFFWSGWTLNIVGWEGHWCCVLLGWTSVLVSPGVTLVLLCISRVRELQELWRTVKTSSQWCRSHRSAMGLTLTDICFLWHWTCRSHDCFKDFAVWILRCSICLQLGTDRTHKQRSFEQTSVCVHCLWKRLLSEWALQWPHEHAQQCQATPVSTVLCLLYLQN